MLSKVSVIFFKFKTNKMRAEDEKKQTDEEIAETQR
jgi:hypothetical protein